jgi:hypothetical protein
MRGWGFNGIKRTSGAFSGTSITYSIRAGVTEPQSFPVLVGDKKLYRPAINAGVGGDTSTGGLSRFEYAALSFEPAMVSIEFGHNETGAGISVATYTANITEMVRRARVAGARVTLFVPILAQDATLNGNIEPYRVAMRGLVSSLSCDGFDSYADMAALPLATQNSYFIDSPGQHLSPAGLAWLAGLIGTGSYANAFLAAT